MDFVSDAFGHLKAIGYTPEAQPLLQKAGVMADDGVVELSEDVTSFVERARTREWERERKVRTLP